MFLRRRVLLAVCLGLLLWAWDEAIAQETIVSERRDTSSWVEQFQRGFAKLKGTVNTVWSQIPFDLNQETHWEISNAPDYTIKVQDFKMDSMHALVLSKLIFLDTAKPRTKPAQVKVFDVLLISVSDSTLRLVGQNCMCNGQNDDTIIALVKDTYTKYLEDVVRAWRVNKKLLILEEIPAKGIRCENDLYGD